jgi:hypothetical protein
MRVWDDACECGTTHASVGRRMRVWDDACECGTTHASTVRVRVWKRFDDVVVLVFSTDFLKYNQMTEPDVRDVIVRYIAEVILNEVFNADDVELTVLPEKDGVYTVVYDVDQKPYTRTVQLDKFQSVEVTTEYWTLLVNAVESITDLFMGRFDQLLDDDDIEKLKLKTDASATFKDCELGGPVNNYAPTLRFGVVMGTDPLYDTTDDDDEASDDEDGGSDDNTYSIEQ